MPAIAGPALRDDIETCCDRQIDATPRLEACENLLTAGQLSSKDLAIALAVRGNALLAKHNYDKAIEAFSTAIVADPDDVRVIDARGIAYEYKGQDDLAMSDYNVALQKRPNFGPVLQQPCRARSTTSTRRCNMPRKCILPIPIAGGC